MLKNIDIRVSTWPAQPAHFGGICGFCSFKVLSILRSGMRINKKSIPSSASDQERHAVTTLLLLQALCQPHHTSMTILRSEQYQLESFPIIEVTPLGNDCWG